MVKRIIKGILKVIVDVIIVAVLILGIVLITEFSPKNGETLKTVGKSTTKLKEGDELTILTYNIGHLVSGEESDFWYEGGETTRAASEDTVTANLETVTETIKDGADIVLLQEVDYKSRMSYEVNEYVELANEFQGISSYAVEQDVFVPYPIPNIIGSVKTGIGILSKYEGESYRLSLPQTYEFPERIYATKKCLQKFVIPLEDSEKSLVVINVDLEDYDDGTMRETQLDALKREMLLEYDKGNYVVAGGDFNMLFPADENESVTSGEYVITKMTEEAFPEGWKSVTDTKTKTFRLRNMPYDKETSITATVDGFITTPNVEVKAVSVKDTEFKNTNHNAVTLKIKLKK